MGQSLDAYIAFGWILPTNECAWAPGHENCTLENPEYGWWDCALVPDDEDDEGFDLEEARLKIADDYAELMETYPYDAKGEYKEGFTSDDGKDWYKKRRAILETVTVPFDIAHTGHWEGDQPKVLYFPETKRCADYGPIEINLLIPPDSIHINEVRNAAKRLGIRIPDTPAKWILWPVGG